MGRPAARWAVCAACAALLCGVSGDTTRQMIVKFREGAAQSRQAHVLSGVRGVVVRETGTGAQVVDLGEWQEEEVVQRQADALVAAHDDIEYAELDRLFYPRGVPNDPQFWQSQPQVEFIFPYGAWDTLQPGELITVAVIDTGMLPGNKEDLSPHILPGHDFTQPDLPLCGGSDSSHGTFVAGVLASVSNNNMGMAGMTNNAARVVPVKIIEGICPASTSTVVDGLLWAAGLDVPGAPKNNNPSRVLTMSLGSNENICSSVMRDALDRIAALGGVVITAAGNYNNTVVGEPGFCDGVITVGALSKTGAKWQGSNYGPNVDISAPGESILVPTWHGYTTASGTSLAAPFVSATVALMLLHRPDLKPLGVMNCLRTTAQPFQRTNNPDHWDCEVGMCGAGVLHMTNAVQCALQVPLPLPCASMTDIVSVVGSQAQFDTSAELLLGGMMYASATVLLNSHTVWGRIFDFGNGPAADNVLLTLVDQTGSLGLHVWRDGNVATVECSTPAPLGHEFLVEVIIGHAPGAYGTGLVYINGMACGKGTVPLPKVVVRRSNFVGRSNWADAPLDGTVSNLKLSTCIHGFSYTPLAPCRLESLTTVVSSSNLNTFTETDALRFGGPLYMHAEVLINKHTQWGRIIDFGNGAASNNILLTQDGTTGHIRFDVYDGMRQTGIVCSFPAPVGIAFTVEALVMNDATTPGAGQGSLVVDGIVCAIGPLHLPNMVARTRNYIGHSNWGGGDEPLDGTVNSLYIGRCPAYHVAPCSNPRTIDDSLMPFTGDGALTSFSTLPDRYFFGGRLYLRLEAKLDSFALFGFLFDTGKSPNRPAFGVDNIAVTQRSWNTSGHLVYESWRGSSLSEIVCYDVLPLHRVFVVEVVVDKFTFDGHDHLSYTNLYVDGVWCNDGAPYLPQVVSRDYYRIGQGLGGTVTAIKLDVCM